MYESWNTDLSPTEEALRALVYTHTHTGVCVLPYEVCIPPLPCFLTSSSLLLSFFSRCSTFRMLGCHTHFQISVKFGTYFRKILLGLYVCFNRYRLLGWESERRKNGVVGVKSPLCWFLPVNCFHRCQVFSRHPPNTECMYKLWLAQLRIHRNIKRGRK